MNNLEKPTKVDPRTLEETLVQYEIDGNVIKLTPSLVQNYIVGESAGKITIPEFKFFCELCKVRKLNPFLKEAYLIKYSNDIPAQIVVGKDAILKRAVLNPAYDGMESGVIVITKDKEEKYRDGTFFLTGEELVGGWAKVYVKGRSKPSYASVNFTEVAGKKKDGSLNSSWFGKSATMVEKVAKVRALREAFVEDLGGMYEAEEFGQEIPKERGSDKVIIEQIEDKPQEIYADEQTGEISINELQGN